MPDWPQPRFPPPPLDPRQLYRRRRTVAAIVVAALIALLIAALSSGGGSARPPAESSARASTGAAHARGHAQPSLRVAENRAIDRVLSYAPAITSGGNRGNEVALTFDDGPGPYTARLVAELNRLGVRATFFAIGKQEQYFSAGTTLELRSGDAVGDHTETHPMLAAMSAHEQREQLFEQIARIELLNGPRPRLFRPPYGSFNATTFRLLHRLHLLMVLWSTDTQDYRMPGVPAIVYTALSGARPGAIILMHDGGGDRSQTIAALPKIVKGLHRKGLHPVTVPRLMLDDPPPRGLPLPTSLAGD